MGPTPTTHGSLEPVGAAGDRGRHGRLQRASAAATAGRPCRRRRCDRCRRARPHPRPRRRGPAPPGPASRASRPRRRACCRLRRPARRQASRGIGGLQGVRVRLVGDPADQDGADPVAAALRSPRRSSRSPCDADRATPGIGTWPRCLAIRPPTVSTSSSSSVDAEAARRGRRSGSASADPHGAVGERARPSTCSASYSSVISPTISSRMSSMVTRPAVPPYSSTTIAMCVLLGLHLAQQLVDRLAVRARSTAGRITDVDALGELARRGASKSRRTMSLR